MQYGGGEGHRFMKLFHKIPLFFERWLPLCSSFLSWLPFEDYNSGDHLTIVSLLGIPNIGFKRWS